MAEEASLFSNVPEFTVGSLAQSLKRTLEDTYGRVRVRGELSRVSIASSGHMYSSLKDENAVIDAVCWKGTLSKLRVKPEEGLEVICTGRITTYPQRSNYQLVIESIELAGQGALLKMLEERKKKLSAEGLFAPERKKPLPFLPHSIGVITSPTGAVIRDILHRLNDRFPVHVMVWPVLVQGASAAEQIAAAIQGFQNIQDNGLMRPDLLIIARGGGSLEDLMPFNDEALVRAVAASKIPIISAVGHETDTTLCDFAADLRAPTPTGAAEMAVPVRTQLIANLLQQEQRLINGLTRLKNEKRHKLEAITARLGDPSQMLGIRMQRLDHLGDRLRHNFMQHLHKKHQSIMAVSVPHPREYIRQSAQKLSRWSEQLLKAGQRLCSDQRRTLLHTAQMLEAYNFEHTLKRGFAVIRGKNNSIISQATQAQEAIEIDIQFQNDQRVSAQIKKH